MGEQVLIAHELYPNIDTPLEPAPIARDWMDAAHQRHPYRCLPLNIANQNGWIMRSPFGFSAYWYGGLNKEDIEVRYDGAPETRILSHFGSGVITFTVPFLFRTPPGINLWVKGPANWIKDGIQPLEGIVESDWLAATFTMNWRMTRVCEWIRFEKGEPFCMIVPVPRGLIEQIVPKRMPIEANPELQQEYRLWEKSRAGFLQDLRTNQPDAVKRGWQKDYFQGKTQHGEDFHEHQTRLAVREFEPVTETKS